MLKLLDLIENYKRSLYERVDYANSIIKNNVEYLDESSSLVVFSEKPGTYLVNDEEYDGTSTDCFNNCKTLLTNIFDNNVYTLPSSDGVLKAFNFTVNNVSDSYFTVIVDDGDIDELLYELELNNDEVLFTNNNPNSFSYTFGDIIKNISESTGVKSVIVEAINLAQKGELTTANFMASIPEYVNKADASMMSVISLIKNSCSGNDPSGQVTSLVSCIKQLYGNIPSASQSGNEITFNDTDYTVDTSIFGPLSNVIQPIGRVLSLGLSLISPIVGAITLGITSIVSTITEYLEDNSDLYFRFNSAADNDCFAMPIIQKKISTPYQSVIPSYIMSELHNNKFIKMVNGLFTAYLWMNDDPGDVFIEIYLSAICDIKYTSGASTGLESIVKDWITINTTPAPAQLILETANRSDVSNVLNTWLDNLSTPGGDVNTYDFSGYGFEEQNALATRRLATDYLLLAWVCMSLYYPDTTITLTPNLGTIDFKKGSRSDSEVIAMTCYYIKEYLYGYRDLDNINNGYYYDYDASGNKNSLDLVKCIVNQGIPALKRKMDDLDSSVFFTNLISPMLPTNLDPDYQSLYDRGCGFTFHTSYIISNKGNGFIYPPQSYYPRWMKAIATTLVVVATTVLVVSTIVAARKGISAVAAKKRQAVDAAYERFKETGVISDYNKAYRLNKKYNRFWGKLSGTTYDMNNQWINYNSESSSAIDTLSMPLYDYIYRAITGNHIN